MKSDMERFEAAVASLRDMPESVEAETAVISGLLAPSADEIDEILSIVKTDHFWGRSHQIIFSCISGMHQKGERVDAITVTTRLKDSGKLEEVGGAYYISKLALSNPLGSHALQYAGILYEKFVLRRTIEIGKELQDRAFQGEDFKVLISNIEEKLFDLNSVPNAGHENKTPQAQLEFQRMMDLRKSGVKITGLMTGIEFIDRIFSGFQRGQYYVLAGRPSAGKSAMADQIVMNLVMKDQAVLYIALEGGPERVYSKIACKLSDVCFTDFILGLCSTKDLEKVENCEKVLRTKPLILVRPRSMDPSEIRGVIKRYAKKNDLKLVVLDFLQKIYIPKGWDERRAVSEASHEIQNACVETGIPGLVLAQLNRESEAGTRPRLRHLKESGDIEQDADNAILLWTEQDPRDLSPGEPLEVICSIEKNKDGPMGIDERVLFERRFMKFRKKGNK